MHWARCQRQWRRTPERPALQADLEEFGAPPELITELTGDDDRDEPEIFDVWLPNEPVLRAFLAVRGQFRYAGMGGPIGFDACAVDVVLNRRKLTLEPDQFGALMDMGEAAAVELNRRDGDA